MFEYFSDDCIFPGPGLLMSEEWDYPGGGDRSNNVATMRQCRDSRGPGHWTGHAQTHTAAHMCRQDMWVATREMGKYMLGSSKRNTLIRSDVINFTQ